MSKKIISIILVLILLQSYICTILAVSTSELNGQKTDLQDKINDAKQEQSELKEDLDKEMQAISSLDHEISGAEVEVKRLESQIEELETSISEKQKLIEEKFNKIIITLEEKGCMYRDENKIKLMPSIKVKEKDTTGAGDIFHGAFVYALANNFDLEKALKYSNIAGCLSVTKMGTGDATPTLKEVEDVYAEIG